MSDRRSENEQLRQIDTICDEFERQLRAGNRPSVDDFLGRIPAGDRPALAVELLRVAVEYSQLGIHNHSCSTATVSSPSVELPQTTALDGLPGSPSTKRLGDYELIEEVGAGGMGVVFRARQIGIDRTVALKILRPDRWRGLSAEQQRRAIERFLVESQAAARRDHPNVLTIFDAGQIDGVYYLAMQFVGGPSLADLASDGPLEDKRAAGYIEPVCRALHAVHAAGIVHRDLKPSNILIDADSDRPLVGDFGLAKVFDSDQGLTLSGDIFGTPAYMSPEQVVNAGRVDISADVYGIGATLYHLVTGRPPFQASTVPGVVHQVLTRDPVPPRMLNPAVSRDMETIALKCLAKEPSRRYPTALDVAQDLQRFLAGQPIKARPLRPHELLWRWCLRHRAIATLLALIVMLMITAVTVVMLLYARERSARVAANRLLAESYRQQLDLDNPTMQTRVLPFLVAAHAHELNTDRELASRLRVGRMFAACPRPMGVMVHRAPITAVAFDANGARIVTASSDGEVKLWSTSDMSAPLGDFEHDATITCAVFTNCGDALVIGDDKGDVSLYKSSPPHNLAAQFKHPSYIRSIVCAPQGELFATICTDTTVRLWKVSEAAQPFKLLTHEEQLRSLQFAPTADMIVTAGVAGRAYAWSTDTGLRLAATPRVQGPLRSAHLFPDGETILITAASGLVSRYPRTLSQGNILREPQGQPLLAAMIDDAGERLLLVSRSDLRVFQCGSRNEGGETTVPGSTTGVAALSPLGSYIATATPEGPIDLWTTEGSPRRRASLAETATVQLVQFGPAAHHLVCAAGQIARAWDVRGTDTQVDLATGPLMSAALADDGETGIAVSDDQRVTYFRVNSAEADRLPAYTTDGSITAIAIGRQGAAWSDREGHVYLAPGTQMNPLELDHTEFAPVCSLAINRDGALLAIGNESGRVRVVRRDNAIVGEWDLGFRSKSVHFSDNTGKLLVVGFQDATTCSIEDPRASPTKLFDQQVVWATATDGRRAAFALADRALYGFDLRNGRQLADPIPLDVPVTLLRFSVDGSRLVGTTSDNRVHVWTIGSGVRLETELSHKAPVEQVCFCHDSSILATVSEGVVRLWDVVHGELIGRYQASSSPVRACGFRPESHEIAMLLAEGTVLRSPHPVDQRSLAQLARDAELWSGHRLNAAGTFVPLPPDEMAQGWKFKRQIP